MYTSNLPLFFTVDYWGDAGWGHSVLYLRYVLLCVLLYISHKFKKLIQNPKVFSSSLYTVTIAINPYNHPHPPFIFTVF